MSCTLSASKASRTSGSRRELWVKPSKIKFSRREDSVLSLLSRRGEQGVTSADVQELIFGKDESEWPYHSRIVSSGLLRSVQKKLEKSKGKRKVLRTGYGRTGSVWYLKG